MDLEKALNNVDIEPLRRLDFAEMGQVVQSFSQKLVSAFPKLDLDPEEIVSKMFECHMYLATIPEHLGSTNYFYKTQAVYFGADTNFKKIDEFIVHECIHYFQDKRDEKDNLQRMGICRFKEFKVHGMAFNEAAIQYITSKILKLKEEEIEYGGIKIITSSPNYYPVLTSLMNQIVFLLGQDSLVESTLYSTDKFKYEYMDIIGEGNWNKILSGFDSILELKQADGDKQVELITKTYEELQNFIMTTYFKEYIPFVMTTAEANEYRKKLEKFERYILSKENLENYKRLKEKQMKKLNKRISEISSGKANKMLMTVNHGKIYEFFKALQDWIFSEEYKSR